MNQLHFTGKQRDTESGNDYFLARYYASGMAVRFLTPDWSKNPQGVPYANYADPQSLDLYSYMQDNPLSGVDADGHLGTLGDAPLRICKGIDTCQKYATEYKKKAAKRLAGFKAKALKFLGRHRKFVKAVNRAIIIGTAISGFADGGASELVVPEEVAGESAIEGAIDAGAGQAAETGADVTEEAAENAAQMKRLSPREIKQLQERGIDPHRLKPNSEFDLFKDRQGNVYVKPKSGIGPGDPTGENLNDR